MITLWCDDFESSSVLVVLWSSGFLAWWASTVYPKKYAHGFVVLCFVVVMQSFIMNSHEVFIHIHQGCFAGTGAIVRLPQCQWSKPDGYGKISQCITTTKHSKAKTVCIFLGIYCNVELWCSQNKLLNKQPSCQWFYKPRCSCDIPTYSCWNFVSDVQIILKFNRWCTGFTKCGIL